MPGHVYQSRGTRSDGEEATSSESSPSSDLQQLHDAVGNQGILGQGLNDFPGHSEPSVLSSVGSAGFGTPEPSLTSEIPNLIAIDREQAAEELAGRFTIVSEGQEHTAPNAVTQEQYDEIVALYSDIRLGRTQFGFDTSQLSEDDARAYHDHVMADIASILQSESGRQLIGDLAHNENGHEITMRPLFGELTENGPRTPEAGLDFSNGYAGLADRSDAPHQFDGEGTDVLLSYNPGHMLGPTDTVEPWLPVRSDVLLYHELVHAHDMVSGTMPEGLVEGQNIRRSEYRAVGIGEFEDEALSANNYRRERRQIGASGVGVREGDEDMALRERYSPRRRRAAAPGSGHGHRH